MQENEDYGIPDMRDCVRARINATRDLFSVFGLDVEAGFAVSELLVNDIPDLPFYFGDYIYRIADVHPQKSLRLCGLVAETHGKSADVPDQEYVLGVAVYVITSKALGGDPGFSRLLDRIVRDDSYNYATKCWIAFIIRPLLYNNVLSSRVLDVYSALLDSSDPRVQSYAEFHLLCTLVSGNKSMLPQIKPALEKASRIKYKAPKATDMFLVEYLAKFWKEIPQDSAECLYRLCGNNRQMTVHDDRALQILDTMDAMFESDLLDRKSRQRLSSALMAFVEAEWPQAGEILEKVGTNM